LTKFSLGTVESGLKRSWVNLEENLALPDDRTFFVVLADDVSRDLRPNLGIDIAIERRQRP
jgi:hypothetical protein